jgi:hypothetical protein
MSDLEKLNTCMRALDKSEKALKRGDLGATFDWLQATLGSLIRLAEDTGHIPKNRRPRRLPAQSRKGARRHETRKRE